MTRLLQACALLWLTAAPALAQNTPVVVELFTSQGCSSCPPADAMLHDIAARDDVIALALHVDYWDYIGWKDEFADPRNTDRQREYAALAERRSIYTPQMIVNGVTDIVGARPAALSKAIAVHKEQPREVDLSIVRNGGTVEISARMLRGNRMPMEVQMLRYTPERESRITRGENAGKTIKYANVTEGRTVLATWNGAEPLELEAPVTGDLPVVVLVQVARSGPILAAARIR